MVLKHIFEIYFFYFLLSTLLFYATGFVLQRLLRIEISASFQKLFFRLLSGCIFFIAGCALIYCKGITVMIGLALLIGYSYFVFRSRKAVAEKRIVRSNKFNWKTIIVFSGGAFIIYSVQYLALFHLGGNMVIPDLDSTFYSNVSNYFTLFGKENLSLDFLQIGTYGCEPYHYGDIWLNTFIKDLFHLNSAFTLKLIVYSFVTLLIFIGYCALAQQIGFSGWLTYLFSLLFLNFGGLYFSFFENIKYLADANIFSLNPIDYPKVGFVYVLLQAALIVYVNGYKLNAIALIAALPVFFITLLPGAEIAIFLLAFKNFLTHRKFRIAINELLPAVLIAAFLLLFYHFQPASVSVNSGQLNETVSTFLSKSYYITAFHIVGLSVAQVAVVFASLLLVIVISLSLNEIKEGLFKNDLVFFALAFFFSSLISWAFFHQVTQTVQLFLNGSVPLIEVFGFMIILYCIKGTSKIKRQILFAVLFFTLTCNIYYCYRIMNRDNEYGDAYLNATAGELKKSYSQCAFILTPEEYSNFFARSSAYFIRGVHLSYFFPDYYSYSLSVFDMPIDENYSFTERKYLENSIFYKYTQHQKSSNSFVSVNQSRLDFIDQYKINYLFISKGAAIDSLLQLRIIKRITDSKTREQFCTIRH